MSADAFSMRPGRSGCCKHHGTSTLTCLQNLAREGEANQNMVKSVRRFALFNIAGHNLGERGGSLLLLEEEGSFSLETGMELLLLPSEPV